MKNILVLLVLGVVLLMGAYVAGYWPQRQRMGVLESERAQLQQRAEAAEAKVRAGQLLGELLTLKEIVQEMNYGQARGLSSPFFDHVRAEAGRTADTGIKQALDGIQSLRDPVTIALTQGDPSALHHLRDAERRMRVALGYPAPAAASAPAVPAPTMAPPLSLPGTVTPGPVLPGATPVPAPTPANPGLPGATPSGSPLGLPTPAPTPTP